MKIAGFVPARGGSTRVPSKNIQKIRGIPLCLWAASNLAGVIGKNNVYIDSDSDEIIEIAQKHGFNFLKRPDDLATNATNGNEFMYWESSQVDADIYIQHLPPMPFLKQETLSLALGKVVSGEYDSAVGVVREKLYLWDENGPGYDLHNLPNSFTLNDTIYEGMGLYICSKKVILEKKLRFDERPYMVELDNFERIDIDHTEDLEFARTVARGFPKDSPYLTNKFNLLVDSKEIRMLILDVDGTLTTGGMLYREDGKESKVFNTKDGRGIIEWQKKGGVVCIVSSGLNDKLVRHRADVLGIKEVYVGRQSKDVIIKNLMEKYNLSSSNIAYVGDDINDIPARALVKVFACPSDSVEEIFQISDVVLSKKGGEGCVREFIDKYLMVDND